MTSVTQNSPAWTSGLQAGDYLVQFQEELVIFLAHTDIEQKLKQSQDLQLGNLNYQMETITNNDVFFKPSPLFSELVIERGQLAPMVANSPSQAEIWQARPFATGPKAEKRCDTFTIVLDKEKGIYHKSK